MGRAPLPLELQRMIERWELSHFPSAKDTQRYRLKLKAAPDDLKRLSQKLPITLSKPFKTLSPDYNWGCYLFQVGDAERAEVERFLRELCPHGLISNANVQIDQELSPLLEDFLETAAARLSDVPTPADVTAPAPSPAPPADPAPAPRPEPAHASTSEPRPAPEEPGEPAAPSDPAPDARAPRSLAPPKDAALEFGSALNPRYTFDEFVVGPHNRFTHAAALAVAETPGKIYNPLFIYGSVGLGKTHLMQAIAHHMCQRQASTRVLYLSAARLIHHVIEAIRQGVIHQLPEQFKGVDVLLVDDVQFLADSEETQEQFFHIFNLLRENNRQIVLTSDRPPRQLSTLADRIRTRFEWGLIADMKAPTLETRVAILKKKVANEPFTLSDDLLVYIATKLTELRTLEGFLQQVHARVSLEQQTVTMDLIQQLVEELRAVPHAPPPPPAPPPAPEIPVPVVTAEQPPTEHPREVPEDSQRVKASSQRAPNPASPPEPAPPEADILARPTEAVFFFPTSADAGGGTAAEGELARVKERFSQIIKKHKLKFQLVSRSEYGYLPSKTGVEREMIAYCQTQQLSVAVVLGPPPEQTHAHQDFLGQLTAAAEEAQILLLWIPWAERAKDYRYLNLALDMTLIRMS